MRFLILFAVLAIAGCAAAPEKSSYDAYTVAIKEERDAAEKRVAAVAGTAEGCVADSCREHIAAIAGFTSLLNGAGRGSTIAPPAPKPTAAQSFAAIASALSPLAGTLVNGYVAIKQTESSERASANQWDAIGSIVSSTTGAMGGVAANAQPNITVGGHYVQGDQHIGDTVGRDLISGTQHVGDTVGRDQAGRDLNNGSHLGNDDRYNSPGPFDRTCEGPSCQSVPVEPVDGP